MICTIGSAMARRRVCPPARYMGEADLLVADLARLQTPNGYLSAHPESHFEDAESRPALWHIPWDCQHRLLSGVLGIQARLESIRDLMWWKGSATGPLLAR